MSSGALSPRRVAVVVAGLHLPLGLGPPAIAGESSAGLHSSVPLVSVAVQLSINAWKAWVVLASILNMRVCDNNT